MNPEELFYKLTALQRGLIVAGVGILLLVGFYFLFIADMRERIDGIERQIGKLKIEITNQEKILKEGPRLKARIENLKRSLQTMVASLPEKQEIEVLLKRITDLLAETNLVATRFMPGKETVVQELYYAKIPITLNVRGDYYKQGSFLAALNSLPRIVNVPTITLREAGFAGREGEVARKHDVIPLVADMSGETYRRLTPEEIERISQPAKGKGGRAGRGRR
ncbi:MAG: type 4a pilus biogenesis protein PilO [Desulfomonilaceae bacterium]|nr:type 4a pilus biogenesis protein PilO [Desulfomonilaceae bacterium]